MARRRHANATGAFFNRKVNLIQGGGQKIRLLKEAFEKYKDRDDVVLLFVDGYA